MYPNKNYQITDVKALAVFSLIVTTLSLFLSPSITIGKILSVLAVCLVLLPLLKSFKTGDYHLSILFFFMFSYVFVPFNYYWMGLHINIYQECENENTVYKALQILCLFHSILLFTIRFAKSGRVRQNGLSEENGLVHAILIAISLLFITFGKSGETILTTGSYSESLQVIQQSSLFGYSVIIISLAYIFSNTRRKQFITYCVIAYFCLKDLLMGGRVDSLQLLLALFFIRLQFILSKKAIIVAAVLGAIFFFAWGAFRSDVNVGFFNALANSISGFGESGSRINFQTGNSAEVYYSSTRILWMIDRGILNISMRLQALFYFFVSAIVPYSMLPDIANLSSYLQSTYWSGGGGLGPVFFYAFGGWIGVVVFSLFVAYSINLFQNARSSKYAYFYAVLVLATTPRWYAYYPVQLIKLCFLGMILYIILNKLFKSTSYNNKLHRKLYKILRNECYDLK